MMSAAVNSFLLMDSRTAFQYSGTLTLAIRTNVKSSNDCMFTDANRNRVLVVSLCGLKTY